jgi:leucyl aminopeptidase
MLYLKALEPAASDADMLVIPVCEDAELHDHPLISSMVARVFKLDEFKGAKGDAVVLYDPPGAGTRRVLFSGLGPAADIDREILRAAAGRAVQLALQKKLRRMAVVVPSQELPAVAPAALIESLLEGAGLANHRFETYKTEKNRRPLNRIDLLVLPDTAQRLGKLPARVWEVCRGTIMARDWVKMPAGDKTPGALARSIAGRARNAGLQVKTFGAKDLQKEKFGAIVAVCAASSSTPAMVELLYAPKGVRKTVVIVGKGVTFDSGGLNLKTSKTLSMMKADMAGAAATAATLLAVARIKPKLRVVGIMPLVENMLSGSAMRPGDIIRIHGGKTVEIGNTDAEGRLILADAIAYAVKRYNPQFLIDMATLTGACVMALGKAMAGLFATDEPLAAAILASAGKTHERCWRMPLPEDYKDLLKSELADINNMPATRWGGAITAALFLKEFVGQTPWAHIDIAGPAYRKNGGDYCGPGATGFGVRLLCDLLGRLE